MFKMAKKLLYLVIVLLIIDIASAATIHGTIYDFYLEKQEHAIVSVNTVPKQTYVASDATYSFELPTGEYEMTAK